MALKTRFCVKCGKEEKKLIDGLCPDCYFNAHKIIVPKRIAVQICSRCGAVKWHGFWAKSSLPVEHYFKQELINKIKLPKEINLEALDVINVGKQGEIKFVVSVLGKKFTQTKQVALEILKGTCKDCSRHLAKTHTVKIQARTKQNIKKFVLDILELSKKYSSAIVKIKEQKKGIDIYISSRAAGKHLARELKKKFKCKLSETTEPYGWNKIKNRPQTRIVFLLKNNNTRVISRHKRR